MDIDFSLKGGPKLDTRFVRQPRASAAAPEARALAMEAGKIVPKNVLLFHIGSLGDTLMALPAMWSLRELWPRAKLTLITKRTPVRHVLVANAILEGTGLFSEVIEYPGTRYGGGTVAQRLAQAWMLAKVRLRRFDTGVYLAPTERAPEQVLRDERFFELAGIRHRIGFQQFPRPPSRMGRPLQSLPCEAEALLDRLRCAGLDVPSLATARLDCGVNKEEMAGLRDWANDQSEHDGGRRWLALAPGSNMRAKVWPIERYAAAAARLVKEFDLWPVAFGGAEDLGACTVLRDLIGRGYVAAGALTPRTAAAGMQRCALYLGNDTGTMHLAASEGVPCVVPFSARDFPGKWHPIGSQHAIVRRRPDCEGCMLEICESENMRCLLDIDIEELLGYARSIMLRSTTDAARFTPGRIELAE